MARAANFMNEVTQTFDTLEAAMAATGHATIVCTCGEQITTCRCWSKDKPVIAVTNGCDECKAKTMKLTSQLDSFTSPSGGLR
jgi:hypothetical protein